jgi:ESCRT-II complex subunit VPS36
LNADSEEMKNIQQVMFNMGLINDFSSQVTKDLAGKNYFLDLAKEVEKFTASILDKFGGVLALVDLYCMYNRARGTDMISPEDLMIACDKLTSMPDSKVTLRTFQSGVKVVQQSKRKLLINLVP